MLLVEKELGDGTKPMVARAAAFAWASCTSSSAEARIRDLRVGCRGGQASRLVRPLFGGRNRLLGGLKKASRQLIGERLEIFDGHGQRSVRRHRVFGVGGASSPLAPRKRLIDQAEAACASSALTRAACA